MSVITIPDAVAASVGGQTYGQVRYEIQEVSEPTGATGVRLLGPPRWRFGLRSKQACSLVDGGEWEAMLLRLRGGVNHLAVYDFLRPAPQGTVRGDTVLNADVAIGATSMALNKTRAENNLLEEGTTFGGTSWSVSNVSVTTNTTARPGSSAVTADTITDASGAAVGYLVQGVTVADDATTYTGSIYVKKTSGGTAGAFAVALLLTGGTAITETRQVNTDTGDVISGTGTVSSQDSGTWWRVSFTITNNTTGNTDLEMRIYPARNVYNTSGFSAAATGSCIVWGAQLETGSTLSAYINTRSLYAGDWLQIGTGVGTSQLVKVVETVSTATSDVLAAITFEPPLRYAFSTGAAVTWDKPVAYCKLTNDALSWAARANGPAIDSFAADLLEDWGP